MRRPRAVTRTIRNRDQGLLPFGVSTNAGTIPPQHQGKRGGRADRKWDPEATKIVFAVRDLDVVVTRLTSRRAPTVTLGGAASDTPPGRAILVRDPDGYLVEARQAPAAAVSAAARGDVIETSIWVSVARLDRALAFYDGLLGFKVPVPAASR